MTPFAAIVGGAPAIAGWRDEGPAAAVGVFLFLGLGFFVLIGLLLSLSTRAMRRKLERGQPTGSQSANGPEATSSSAAPPGSGVWPGVFRMMFFDVGWESLLFLPIFVTLGTCFTSSSVCETGLSWMVPVLIGLVLLLGVLDAWRPRQVIAFYKRRFPSRYRPGQSRLLWASSDPSQLRSHGFIQIASGLLLLYFMLRR